MELFKAHKQWATRPEDERFQSLEDLYRATKGYAEVTKEKRVPFADLRVEAIEGDVQLVGKAGIPARLTNWAFGQLASRLGAPASYLRELPATLTCQNLNHGLATRVAELAGNSLANLMFHTNGNLLLRSITTDDYARIWNHEVCERLIGLQSSGWAPASPDIRKIDDRLPLYASDRDMFVFLSNRNVTIAEAGSTGAVYRGVIVENSEVGASALKLTRFLYREMCGNHIIWGASNVVDISVRHVGDARRRWAGYFAAVQRYAEESASDLEARIASAKSKLIAATKEGVLDALFGKRGLQLSRKAMEAGFDACQPEVDGDARSPWGLAQGLTRYSQTIPFANERTAIDRAAGKMLDWF